MVESEISRFWVNQHLHFGVVVTSPIEGYHSTLKSYLQRRNRDLQSVFIRMNHFWDTQQISIRTTTAQQQIRSKHSTNISLFAAILQQVNGNTLQKILTERAKLPVSRPPMADCTCTIQQSIGLPCFHTIWKRQREGGVILLEDIHPH